MTASRVFAASCNGLPLSLSLTGDPPMTKVRQQESSRDAYSAATGVAENAARLPMANEGRAQPGLTVYFDGACPLCRREIDFYRRMSGGEAVAWVNISGGTDEQLAPGLTRDGAARRLHARLPDGRVVSGARAFAQMWLSLNRLKWLGYLANLPLIEPILEQLYKVFLRLRPQLQRLAVRWETLSQADR